MKLIIMRLFVGGFVLIIICGLISLALISTEQEYKVEYNGQVFYTKNIIMHSYGCLEMLDLDIEVCGNFKKEVVKSLDK